MPFIDAIPSDYDGMMGVPITFLDKYNPDQFEIVGSGRRHATTMPRSSAFDDARETVEVRRHIAADPTRSRRRTGSTSNVTTREAAYKRILIRRKDAS